MKQLSACGIKTPRKQADIISEHEEEALWSKCILGSDTPVKLADTLLYMFGLHNVLHAGNEHRNFCFVNFQLSPNADKLRTHQKTCKEGYVTEKLLLSK